MIWRKSSHSSDSYNCVEIAADFPVRVRDSKDPDGPVLTFEPKAWTVFVDSLKENRS